MMIFHKTMRFCLQIDDAARIERSIARNVVEGRRSDSRKCCPSKSTVDCKLTTVFENLYEARVGPMMHN